MKDINGVKIRKGDFVEVLVDSPTSRYEAGAKGFVTHKDKSDKTIFVKFTEGVFDKYDGGEWWVFNKKHLKVLTETEVCLNQLEKQRKETINDS